MDGDKVYGLCSLCGGALLSDHDCIGFRKVLGLPPAVDWHAVARDAAVALYEVQIKAPECMLVPASRIAALCCDAAIALVAEMRKRDGFGGQT